jgi:hypothetical protein
MLMICMESMRCNYKFGQSTASILAWAIGNFKYKSNQVSSEINSRMKYFGHVSKEGEEGRGERERERERER